MRVYLNECVKAQPLYSMAIILLCMDIIIGIIDCGYNCGSSPDCNRYLFKDPTQYIHLPNVETTHSQPFASVLSPL